MSSTRDAFEAAAYAAAFFLAEIRDYEVPQVDECGSLCARTAIGMAWNAAIEAGTLEDDLNKYGIGSRCEMDGE